MINGKPSTFKTKQNEGKNAAIKKRFLILKTNGFTYQPYQRKTTDEHSINTDVLDLLSGFYYLRTQNLIIGVAFVYINIF